ncbi:cation:proton antiporter [bacterium]|nr:cation:proton antiporter [bacterium]
MRSIAIIILLAVIAVGIGVALTAIPFGVAKTQVGDHYTESGIGDTGASNIVTSVVVGYRAFDTLGEITILFVAAMGLGAVLAGGRKLGQRREVEPASLILRTGCRFLFPLLLLFGAYIFIHGHLTPGGGFQGGAVIASAFLLVYLGCPGRRVSKVWSQTTESLGALTFVVLGLVGLTVGGHYYLSNFMPHGVVNELFSAGIIPVIYVAIGLKVGSDLTGIIDGMMEETI